MDRPERSARDPRTWWFLAVQTVKDAKDDRLFGLGGEVAFFSLLSLPPTLLAIFGAVGYIAEALGPDAVETIRDQILGAAAPFLTERALEGAAEVLDRFLTEGRAGVASIGVVLALWSASRATNAFMEAVHIAYDTEESRSGVRRRIVAFGITILGIIGAVVVIPLIVAGPRFGAAIGRPLGLEDVVRTAWRIAYWPGVGLLGLALLTSFYSFALSARTPWRRDLPGAILAAVLWFAGAAGLRLYISISIEGNATYGSLGAPIAVLLWLYVTAVALLLGAELNAEIEKVWPTESEGLEDSPAGGRREKRAPGLRRPFAQVTKRVETIWKR